jgi:hypothetical protein
MTRQTLLQGVLWALSLGLLACAFLAYLQPSFVLDLANRFWLCT